MDAIALIKQDHSTIKELFKSYQALGEEAHSQKRRLVAEMVREISIHAAMEEAALYPYIRQRDEELAHRVVEALEEHKVVKWTLVPLERLEPGDERYDAKVKVLIDTLLHHIEEEENDILPKLRQRASEEELLALADALRAAKRVAPTHPHPRVPDQPPGNTMVVPVMAAMDRSLDRATQTLERGRSLAESALERGRELVQRLRDRVGARAEDTRRRVAMRADDARRRMVERAGDARRRMTEVSGRVRRAALEQGEELRREAARTLRQAGESVAVAGEATRRTTERTARKAAPRAPKKKTASRTRRAAGKTARRPKKQRR